MRANVRELEHPRSVHWLYQWARIDSSVCEQLPIVYATYEPVKPDSAASIKKILNQLGDPFEEAGCDRFKDSLMALTTRDPATIISKLLAIEGVTAARASSRMRYHEDFTDEERFDLLSAELSGQAALLEKTPTMRAFVRGEIERVRKTATVLRSARGKRLVVVKIAAPVPGK